MGRRAHMHPVLALKRASVCLLIFATLGACSSERHQLGSSDDLFSGGSVGTGGYGGIGYCLAPRPGESPPSEVCGAPRRYELTEVDNVSPPMPYGTGIGCDGGLLWLPYSEGTGRDALLMLFDPESSAVLRRFDYPEVGTLGGSVEGITLDDGSVWLAIMDNPGAGRLLQIDASDGRVLNSIPCPWAPGPVDLELVGSELMLSSGWGELFVVNRGNGAVLRQFAIGNGSERDSGLAYRDGELWVPRMFAPGAFIFDAASGSLTAFATGFDAPGKIWNVPSPACFAGDRLVTLTERGITYYEVRTLE